MKRGICIGPPVDWDVDHPILGSEKGQISTSTGDVTTDTVETHAVLVDRGRTNQNLTDTDPNQVKFDH